MTAVVVLGVLAFLLTTGSQIPDLHLVPRFNWWLISDAGRRARAYVAVLGAILGALALALGAVEQARTREYDQDSQTLRDIIADDQHILTEINADIRARQAKPCASPEQAEEILSLLKRRQSQGRGVTESQGREAGR